MIEKNHHTLASRTLRITALRIGLVAIFAGAISYSINQTTVEDSVRQQLVHSTEQTLQRESLPFREIRELQRNFLAEFKEQDGVSVRKRARDFDQIFYRHADGSYTQRPGLFEGRPLPDGRSFAGMSATYAPDIPPDDDIKSRFALSYFLSHKYGSTQQGRLFNFYGVLPEKGFPIYQATDIAKVFTYSGPDALKLATFEFYSQGFGSAANDTIYTRMYWDPSNAAWMTTLATPDVAGKTGKHRILACVDVLLDELMRRTAKPAIQGARSTIFLADSDGTLLYHPDFTEEIKSSEGHASIKSLKIKSDYRLLNEVQALKPGAVSLIETNDELVAFGLIPQTPWVLTVHYPKSLMQPAILQNLAIVLALGIFTLLVEVFIIRSILQNQVAIPLSRLIRATRMLGMNGERMDSDDLPTHSKDEIGELARDFASMAKRVQDSQLQLQSKVQERTAALEEANLKLMALSTTDGLTGIANRRRFDEMLNHEWSRATRSGQPLALAMLDIDWFKKYNDHYGHQAGDECLRRIATTLASSVCRSGDLVARYGGEEFVFLAPATDGENALALAEKVCAALAAQALPHDQSRFGYVTASIGIAVMIPEQDDTPNTLVKAADDALYLAKEQGRNRAVLA